MFYTFYVFGDIYDKLRELFLHLKSNKEFLKNKQKQIWTCRWKADEIAIKINHVIVQADNFIYVNTGMVLYIPLDLL